ncbi:MAG: fatty acid desaturase [Planctomyces sp.]|nr:fatty acid desaturase [Planctomyces sp.]
MNSVPLESAEPQAIHQLHEIHPLRHVQRIVCFIALHFIATNIALIEVNLPGVMKVPILIACWLTAGASLHGISLFTHEAVHGTLCRRRVLNDIVGALCAFPVLQTCAAYRVLHLRHHRHLGDAGDPDHYENYTQWTWMVFIMNWLRLFIGYPVYITMIPILGFRQGTRVDRIWIVGEVCALAALVAAIVMSPIPLPWIVHGWIIPMLFINTMVNIRGMSQHTLLEHAKDPIQGTRSILTNGLVRFFMCNENYHLEHHLYPGVPWHGLPQLHAMLQSELTKRGAPFIGSYLAFVREFLIHSLRRSPFGRRSLRQ